MNFSRRVTGAVNTWTGATISDGHLCSLILAIYICSFVLYILNHQESQFDHANAFKNEPCICFQNE